MELPGAAYFYSIAALAIAFVGFSAIVVVLRQGTGKPMSPLHLLFTHLFVELGIMATGFAILAPTLAICGLPDALNWRVSSAVMLVVMVPWLVTYAARRKAAAPDLNLPLRYWVMTTLGVMVVVLLSLNAVGSHFTPGPGPLAIATIYVLAYASVAFIGTYSSFLRD